MQLWLDLSATSPPSYSTLKPQSIMTKVSNFSTLTHLDSIGLVQFNNFGVYPQRSPKNFTVSYCGASLTLTMPNEKDNELPIGKVLLTRVGSELASVCQVPGVEGFVDYVKEKWKMYLPEDRENHSSQFIRRSHVVFCPLRSHFRRSLVDFLAIKK